MLSGILQARFLVAHTDHPLEHYLIVSQDLLSVGFPFFVRTLIVVIGDWSIMIAATHAAIKHGE